MSIVNNRCRLITILDFAEARDDWVAVAPVDHMQIISTSLQTGNRNYASTLSLHIFYRPDALFAAQPTASKHWMFCADNGYPAVNWFQHTKCGQLPPTATVISGLMYSTMKLPPLFVSVLTSAAWEGEGFSGYPSFSWDYFSHKNFIVCAERESNNRPASQPLLLSIKTLANTYIKWP